MATREDLHRAVDALDDERVARARLVVVDDDQSESEMAPLPAAWQRFDDGTPVPNWVALLDRSRRGH